MMQYGYIDDARLAYITLQSDTQYPWVIGRHTHPNPVEKSDNFWFTPINDDQPGKEITI